MKIYLVSQNKNNNYDTYDSMIVYAESEDNAKVMSPGEYYKFHDNSWFFQFADGTERAEDNFSWTHPDNVKVEYIGEAKDGVEEGVITTSFNAG